MVINAKEIFIWKKALNGDVDAICEMVNINANRDNMSRSKEYFELLVEHEPKLCEAKMKAISGYDVPYEDMLTIIGGNYKREGNYILAHKWFQKYIDYMEFKNAKYPYAEWHRNKDYDSVYRWMFDCGELNKAEHRFLLKWEQDLFYKK